MKLPRSFFASIKCKLMLKKLDSLRKKALNNNLTILKNCILMIQKIGIPENEKEAEDLKFAIKHYEEAIKELEADVDKARFYTKEN